MFDIRYLQGRELDSLARWAEDVAEISRHQPHLLPQKPEALRGANEAGRVVIAIDAAANSQVVGCIVLWELDVTSHGASWFELGTVVVVDGYRHRDNPTLFIADALYAQMLGAFPGVNILATTTNESALKSGERAGLKHPGFRVLPPDVQAGTCICPHSKTGVDDPRLCPLRDQSCFMRVSEETWQRLGHPPHIPFSHIL